MALDVCCGDSVLTGRSIGGEMSCTTLAGRGNLCTSRPLVGGKSARGRSRTRKFDRATPLARCAPHDLVGNRLGQSVGRERSECWPHKWLTCAILKRIVSRSIELADLSCPKCRGLRRLGVVRYVQAVYLL